MSPRPPSSPLFPYTTLFRSLNTALDAASRLGRLNLAGAVFVAVIVASNLIGVLRDYRQRQLNTRVMLSLRRSLLDRKSTRLNSSHTVISYAVFCLKKKKQST